MEAAEFVDIPEDRIDEVIGNYNPVVIITTRSVQRQCNAAPFAMCMEVCHQPPLLAFSVGKGKDTCRNVTETGEFVVNVPGEEILKELMVTAKRYPPGVNELKEAGLQELPGKKVSVSRIKECGLHLECRVEWMKEAGDHFIIVGRVVSATAAREILTEDFRVKMDRLRPIHYLGRGTDMFLEVGNLIEAGRPS